MRAARDGERRGWPGLPLARTGGRQRPGAPRHDPVGVALPDVPEEQRTGAMVPHANNRSPRYHPQDQDRRPLPPQGQALARKLLVALWQLVTTGEVPEGVV